MYIVGLGCGEGEGFGLPATYEDSKIELMLINLISSNMYDVQQLARRLRLSAKSRAEH